MYDNKTPALDPLSFTSDKQRDLFAYWQKIKGDLLMPCRKDLNPTDIPHLLSSIWMADVIAGDVPHFKVRLFGTNLVRAFEREGTNVNLDEFSFTGDIIERLTNLVKTRQAYYCECEHPIESEDIKYYSTLTLPLSSDNENVDIIISALDFYT
ncbi:MAG: hypothetical protein COB49_00795 [Alphaproteobacteria bacterium]|nr:MAG: hypothetical protein COB49_00795 [Alphaproteobacteria bacterium]